MTETKAAEPTTEWLRDMLTWPCPREEDRRAAADRLLSLSRELESANLEIGRLEAQHHQSLIEDDKRDMEFARLTTEVALLRSKELEYGWQDRAALASRCEELTELVREATKLRGCNDALWDSFYKRAESLLSTASDEGEAKT